MNITFGLASGLGNSLFMLPTIKAAKLLGHHVSLFVQTDFPTIDLWRRCSYADEVFDSPIEWNGNLLMCGQWRPHSWNTVSNIKRIQLDFPYIISETDSNFKLAAGFEWRRKKPDVSDWCYGLDRSKRWDVGIVPGSKGGVWMRKRWPKMAEVAEHFLAEGLQVAVFGQESDGIDLIPGQKVTNIEIADLPDKIAGCRVVIGTDSGLTQLASSLGIPCIVVYTATSEVKGKVLGPHKNVLASLPCRPCQSTDEWHRCKVWRCREIAVNTVITAAKGYLNGNRES